jgi:hypothetical protein
MRPRPRAEQRPWAAATNLSFSPSDFRLLANTPPKPQQLHLYLGLPEPLEPFLTMSVLPHFLQVQVVVAMSLGFPERY